MKAKFCSLLVTPLIICIGSFQAQAALLVTYEFTGDSLAPTTTGANVSSTNLAAGVSATTNTLSFTDSGSGSNGGPTGFFASGSSRVLSFSNTDYEEDETNALNAGQYVAFTLTADPTFSLDLSTISFGHSRSNSAPRRISVYVQTSKEGSFVERGDFANNGTLTLNDNDYFTVDLAALGTNFSGVTSAEFRFVFHDDNSSPGVGYLENVALEGSVIPEPSTALLLVTALGTLLVLRRRSSRA